jgi:hypothetical protein
MKPVLKGQFHIQSGLLSVMDIAASLPVAAEVTKLLTAASYTSNEEPLDSLKFPW